MVACVQPPLPSKKSERLLSDLFEERGGCTQAIVAVAVVALVVVVIVVVVTVVVAVVVVVV